jgi:hypothetical protein
MTMIVEEPKVQPKHRFGLLESEFPIQPRHIDAEQPMSRWWGEGTTEAEMAMYVVRYYQVEAKGDWAQPLMLGWLSDFCATQGKHFERGEVWQAMGRLLKESWLIMFADGRWEVTHEFVTMCFLHHPVRLGAEIENKVQFD